MVITSASSSQRGKDAEKTYGFGTPRVKSDKVGQIFDPHVIRGPCCGAMNNSRCRNRLVEHDDASMHPFDQDFVTLKVHSKTNNTKRQTGFALS